MKAVGDVFQVYHKCGFHAVKLHCDKQFEPAVNEWRSKQVPIANANYCNTEEHVPRAERNNRTIQERTRTSYYQMPCNHLPRQLMQAIVTESTRKLNYFPARHEASKHYSSRLILHRENLDFKTYCVH